jgi:hypothetical protein
MSIRIHALAVGLHPCVARRDRSFARSRRMPKSCHCCRFPACAFCFFLGRQQSCPNPLQQQGRAHQNRIAANPRRLRCRRLAARPGSGHVFAMLLDGSLLAAKSNRLTAASDLRGTAPSGASGSWESGIILSRPTRCVPLTVNVIHQGGASWAP